MAVFFIGQPSVFAQDDANAIQQREVSRIIHVLASDSLKGRGNGRPELLQAGVFIGDEFKKSGLRPLPGHAGYFLPFRPFGGSKKIVSDELVWNGKKLDADAFMYIHPAPGNYSPKDLSAYTVVKIDSFFTADILEKYKNVHTDLLLWSNKPQPDKENYFPPAINIPGGGLTGNVLLVCATHAPESISLTGVDKFYSNAGYNVAGILPGRSRPNEIIMFSAHYDHEGVFRRGRKKDSIMNGANDNASGTTALLALADYFGMRADNERTILFCAFSGEELGLLGSNNFVHENETGSIIAGINIEMIAIPQYGKNNVFITGFNESELPAFLKKNFGKTNVGVKSGPSEEKQLFRRSDNFSFVKEGVPAHSIMSSDDDDKCYHQPCDELDRVDISHMTTIIRAIAEAAIPLIRGEQTPKRVSPAR
jgi:hypothetical protein